VDGFGPSFPSTDALSKGNPPMLLHQYMEKRIKRCLSNPAILVLALVYLSASSAKPPKAVLPAWATRAL
jgi:hypothetical protein